MLRFMAPYLMPAAVAVIAGVPYGAGAIDVPMLYAVLLAAIVVAGIRYARWDVRRHPPRR